MKITPTKRSVLSESQATTLRSVEDTKGELHQTTDVSTMARAATISAVTNLYSVRHTPRVTKGCNHNNHIKILPQTLSHTQSRQNPLNTASKLSKRVFNLNVVDSVHVLLAVDARRPNFVRLVNASPLPNLLTSCHR